ncbi:MAG: valine--tRNA ligase [Chloroflexi bacterium]|nr:valine--tRNA ligase [Chloroflexota bacterium]
MPKAFDPRGVEERLYAFWDERGSFTPDPAKGGEPYCIVIPPPNVTGELHHGHAMFLTFQDLMIRWRRMQGYLTLWLPGTDHAGIATQNVVEEELAKEGLTRHDLGRQRFVERVWQWKEKYGGIIAHQMRRMGASCDWTRERFTLDEGLSRAVRAAFVRLYEKGLIYRGTYLVNWCPRCATAISDLEVEHEETDGHLWYVRYAVEGAPQGIDVATTRPETILGDTAVAVNPHDERYEHLVGKTAVLPVLGRRIPIIADAAVDPEFGTGAVKVTPAHDPTDYEIGQRHSLPFVNVMNADVTMSADAGPYAGLDRYACRERLVRDLEARGQLVKVEPHRYAVGRCSRCDTVVEPRLSDQWFVRIQPLAEPAIAVARDGRIRFVPERFTRVYFNWMENIRDWCISRQLWWGHRIPVWYCDACPKTVVAVDEPRQCPGCGGPLRQDEDVLDTWFSSGLWPFSTLGWPDDTADLRTFYPTTVMETGYDILFFWVARMIMLGVECMGDVPFRWVYLHGLMRDEKGEKMSKSKGNVANPLDVIERYGADALRFTIATGSSPGNDMKLSQERIEGSRNFANKLWNAARFVWLELERHGTPSAPPAPMALEDRWIASRTSEVVATATRLLEEFQFGEAGRVLYEFVWSEFCDWYIELAKIRLRRGDVSPLPLLCQTLDTILRLLHPYMPFVTEEVYQHLRERAGWAPEALIVAPWPAPGARDEPAEREVAAVIDLVRALRNLRAEHQVATSRWLEVTVAAGARRTSLAALSGAVEALARVRPLRVVERLETAPANAVPVVVSGMEAFVPLAELVDYAAERERLGRELAQVEQDAERLRALLSRDGFVAKAPPPVVERERARLAEREEQVVKLRERVAALG